MLVDAHVHIGKSTRLQIDASGDLLVRIADRMGFDKICCTDLTALFYDMHEGNRLLAEEMRKNPNMAAPDLDLEDALAKQREEFEAKLKEQEEKATTQMLQQRRAEHHARIRSEGLDPDEIEKLMETEAIGNYDTAIKYAKAQKSLAPPTPEAVTPMSLPSGKDLWSDKNKFARSAAFEAINELKASRGFGR